VKAGWQTKILGEICEIERGGSPRPIGKFLTSDPNGINWIKIGDTKNVTKYITKTQEKIIPEGAKNSRMVFEGDFILSNSMSFGRPYIMKTSGCIHDGWLVLRQRELQVNQDFLYYVLTSDLVFQQFDRLAAGSTVRNLNISLVSGVKIPIPPLLEQQRLVAILDQAFAAIATAKANAEKNLENARAIFESHLQSVFTKSGEGWVEKNLGDICQFENGDRGKNYPNRNEYVVSGIPWINTGHIQPNGTLSKNEMNYITRQKFNSLRSGKIQAGDLVYCLRGATLGKTAIVDPLTEGAVASSLVIIRPSHMLNSRFLYYFLTSSVGRSQIKLYDNGAAQPNLGAKSVAKYAISLPKVEEQESIVKGLDAIAKETQHLEAIYRQKLAALDELKKSLLHQAFSGEL
jgi:type I restriction enzyme, S subunit